MNVIARASVLLSMLLCGAAEAQITKPQQRKPEFAGAAEFLIAVPWTTLELGDGRNETFTGKMIYWKQSGPTYTARTDLRLEDGNGRIVDLSEDFHFRLSKEGDAGGDAVELLSSTIPRELSHRLVDTSDFALVPLRLLFPHKMPTSTGRRDAVKEINHEDYHVEYTEKYNGVTQVSRTRLHKYLSRTVRTFRPSGFQLIDYTLTFEDQRDDTIMAGFGIRMLVHPTLPLPNGDPAPCGVFHIAVIKAFQLDWLKLRSVINEKEWDNRFPEWKNSTLGEHLFMASVACPTSTTAIPSCCRALRRCWWTRPWGSIRIACSRHACAPRPPTNACYSRPRRPPRAR